MNTVAATLAAAEKHDGGMSDPAGQENGSMTTATVDEATAERTDEDQKLQEILDEATLTGEVPNEVIHVKSRRGFLTIDPDQTEWTPAQLTALKSIDIETEGKDAIPRPYVLQFLYVCQIRDLDPLLREAYLITHGNWWQKDNGEWVDSRKFTLVIGIEGFRKRGEDTGEYRGQTEAEWCGEDGVWRDFWNPKWGNPVMARVGIMRAGFDMPVYGKAAFDEFCPMIAETYWDPQKRRKVKTDKLVPTPMWKKMGINQIAKCAEAQGFRKAYPRQMNGLYAEEEMDRAKVEYEEQTRERQHDAAQQRRVDAYAASQAKNRPAAADGAVEGEIVEDGRTVTQQPVSARDAVQETVAGMQAQQGPRQPQASAEQRLAWLVDEVRLIEKLIMQPITELARRQIEVAGKPIQQFTADELQRAVNPLRPTAIAKLRAAGRGDEADAYSKVPPGVAVPLRVLLGQPDDAPAASPGRSHQYVDNGGVCGVEDCDRFSDDPVHAQP
jgi:phage recombination protein Bet